MICTTDLKIINLAMEIQMPKFQVRRYTQEVGEIEADSMEDAALLLKYGHGPLSWQKEDSRVRLVDPEQKMIRNIDDYKG
jgi:hypothetical protein